MSRFENMYDNRSEIRAFNLSISKKVVFVIVCIVLSLVALGLEICLGKADIGFIEAYTIIWDHITGNLPTDPVGIQKDEIVWQLRIPRALGAFFIGITLAVCGAAMQSIMKNPLADPYTTGISSGAGFGAILAISIGFCLVPGVTGYNAIVINAFVFSLIPTAAIVLISKLKNANPTTMILAGLGVMYAFSSMTSLLMLVADPQDHKTAYVWNIGTVGAITWDNLIFVIVAAVIAVVFMQYMAKNINILAMSDANANALGVDANRLRIYILIVTAVTVAMAVSFTGSIGFIGLLAPHIVRIFIGSDNRYLIPASAAFGGMLLLYSDCVAKSIGVTGLPVGVITAAIGGPLFLYVLFKHRKKIWS
ncbi:MAG: FecCD family ABC transporter permease [Candidatus Methanomethylophilaceae archaeon]